MLLCYFCNLGSTNLKVVRFSKAGLVFLLLGVFTACSVQKYIPEQSLLLNKNKLLIDNHNYPEIQAGDILPYIQPKPNRRFLFTRIPLWYYYRHANHPTKINTLINKKFREEPAYFYADDAKNSVRKIQRYLNDIGFFHSKITYQFIKRGKLIDVVYHITPSSPYRYDSIVYQVQDSALLPFIKKNLKNSLLKKGDIYNAYTMDDERNRITSDLRNNGYFHFNRNYIQYQIDTNLRKKGMLVQISILNKEVPDGENPGQLISLPHQRYFIKNVWVIPDYHPLEHPVYDTLKHIIHFKGDTTGYGYWFLCNKNQRFNLHTFDDAIYIKPMQAYSDAHVQQTYKRLFNFPLLRSVNINFDTTNARADTLTRWKYLNARIKMQTAKLNAFSVETMGTNSSGNLGVNGVLAFTNRNIFKRAEVFRLRLMGGFEAQNLKALTSDSTGMAVSGTRGFFNTFEAGIDATLFFPMALFPFRNIHLPGNPETHMGLGFNYQLRPYYSRDITNMDVGYTWNQTKLIKHIFTPININFVKINPSREFQNILDKETNQRLKEQYSDHMIVGLKYSFILNNQQPHQVGNFNYLRLDFESSGNLLNAVNKIFGNRLSSQGYYNVFGIRYSQYVRFMGDYRHYIHFDNQGTALVFRGLVGLAIPYGNSNDIPFEKGFYAGGANDMRGWKFRTLGPGAFQSEDGYERIGDIQLETNVEYRFSIYHVVKGALFVDAGNIWNYHATETYPGGQFQWNNFIKQMALDGGFGIRLDFSYFIFRVDAALPLHDPSRPAGAQWRFSGLQWKDVVANFGIGYPF